MPESAAFQRFSALNAKNLLYYQVQLNALEERILHEEEKTGLNVNRYDLLAAGADSHSHHSMLELQELLRTYSEFNHRVFLS